MTIRVLMVIQSFVPAPGGAQRFVYALASHLPRYNILASIVSTTLWWTGPDSHSMLESEEMLASDSSAGFQVFRIRPRLIRGYPLFFGFECTRILPRFDVVHIHGTLGVMPYYLPLFLVGRLFRKRLIVTIHLIVSVQGNWFNNLLNSVGLLILNLSNAITVVSPNDVMRVSRLVRDARKVKLTLPGVDYTKEPVNVAAEYGQSSKSDFTLLTVGSLNTTKGIDSGLRAFALLRSYPAMRYLVVGPDVGQGEYLKKLVRELRLEDRVSFVGYVLERDLLRDYYEQADVVVIPSRYETTPLVALEAMALGKPIVATMVGGLPFLIKNEWNGLLVRPSSPEALASAIERLFKDAALRDRLAMRACEFSKRYSWDNVSEEFASLYSQSVTKHG